MNFKVARYLTELKNAARDRARPLSKGSGKVPEFKIMKVPNLGEIAAGRVVPFVPKNELVPVVVPVGTPTGDIATLTVRGLSLSDLGIYDGDKLILRLKFRWTEIREDTICAIFLHSTGELVAKKVIRGANMLILRASGGGIPDKEVNPDDVEIRGIVTDVQRPIENFPCISA
jgi:SOS-response transcriptional repressor LexA